MYRFDPDSVNVTVYFKFRDSTTGLAKTGLTAGSAGAGASYTRERGSAVSFTLSALATPTDLWTQDGFIEVDAVKSPGLYRVDVRAAAAAAGARFFLVSLKFNGVIEETVLCRLDKSQSNVGPGAIPWTINVVSSVGGTPLAGARVWISTDAGGTNIVAGTLQTDAFGNVTFFLNAGTYYVWVADPGYTGTNPTTIVVA